MQLRNELHNKHIIYSSYILSVYFKLYWTLLTWVVWIRYKTYPLAHGRISSGFDLCMHVTQFTRVCFTYWYNKLSPSYGKLYHVTVKCIFANLISSLGNERGSNQGNNCTKANMKVLIAECYGIINGSSKSRA